MSMSPADVAAAKAARSGAGAVAPAQPALQPSGGNMFDFNPGTGGSIELARTPAKKPGTLWRG